MHKASAFQHDGIFIIGRSCWYVDAAAFGRPFIANPDLPRRFAIGAALNEPDAATFYGGDARGNTDYPALDD